MENIGLIYCIKNIVNNKVYIGKTIQKLEQDYTNILILGVIV